MAIDEIAREHMVWFHPVWCKAISTSKKDLLIELFSLPLFLITTNRSLAGWDGMDILKENQRVL